MKKSSIAIILGIVILIVIIMINYNYNTNDLNQNSNDKVLNNVQNNTNGGSLIDRTIDNIIINIKEGTLTKTSATVIITNNNEKSYSYDEWYRIEKEENEEWEKIEEKDSYVFTEMVYIMEKNSKIELKIDWSNVYGELEKGKYRLIRRINDHEYKYFWVEFNID